MNARNARGGPMQIFGSRTRTARAARHEHADPKPGKHFGRSAAIVNQKTVGHAHLVGSWKTRSFSSDVRRRRMDGRAGIAIAHEADRVHRDLTAIRALRSPEAGLKQCANAGDRTYCQSDETENIACSVAGLGSTDEHWRRNEEGGGRSSTEDRTLPACLGWTWVYFTPLEKDRTPQYIHRRGEAVALRALSEDVRLFRRWVVSES